jgi:RNA recognition motif-containing protein
MAAFPLLAILAAGSLLGPFLRHRSPPWAMCAAWSRRGSETPVLAPPEAKGPLTTLIIHQVAEDTTWYDLKDFFESYGPVGYATVFPESRRGLVRFTNEQDARRALEDAPRRYGGTHRLDLQLTASKRRTEESDRATNVYISNLPAEVTWKHLRDHFASAGSLVYTAVFPEEQRGVLRFANREDAEAVCNSAAPLRGNTLRLSLNRDEGLEGPPHRTVALSSPPPPRASAMLRETFVSSSPGPRAGSEEGPLSTTTTQWQRRGNDSLADGSPEDVALVAEVEGWLKEREEHQRLRQYKEADAIQAMLIRRGISLIDNTRHKRWSVQPLRIEAVLRQVKDIDTGEHLSGAQWRYRPPYRDSPSEDVDVPLHPRLAEVVQTALRRRQALIVAGFEAEAIAIKRALARSGFFLSDKTRRWCDVEIMGHEPNSIIVGNIPEGVTPKQLRAHFRPAGKVTYAAIFKQLESGEPTGKGVVRFRDPDAVPAALTMIDQPLKDAFLTIKTDRGRGPPPPPNGAAKWTRSWQDPTADGSPGDKAFAEMVNEALELRQRHRDNLNFEEADKIRAGLWAKNVFINDGDRTWNRRAILPDVPEDYTSVIVRNLPPMTTWQVLRDHFASKYEVAFAAVFVDRETGAPKDSGVLRFGTHAEAKNAVDTAHTLPLDGHVLNVTPDRRPNTVIQSSLRWVRHIADLTADGSPEDRKRKAWVMERLEERQRLREARDFDAADAIRKELEEDGVVLDSVNRMWSYGPPEKFPWVRAENDSARDPGDEKDVRRERRVNRLLHKRQAARYLRNFARADAVEGTLQRLHIKMDAEKRVWWAGNLTD